LEKAVVFNIMHYSIHDGPGIRTTVFFKGCPLSCKWCHNPESLQQKPQDVFNPQKCINCGRCKIADKADACPTGARETIGYEITAPDLMKEIIKDVPFYEQSGGGVTFSGGEPFVYADFLLEILTRCKKECIHTVIDTSGFCDTEVLLKAAKIADCFLYDVKFFNREKHEKYCGASNEQILENLKCLSREKTKILIRIPVIPAVNDDLAEMTAIYNFIKDLGNIEIVHLLPYHDIHGDKYRRLEMQYELSGIPKESQNMNEIEGIFKSKFRTRVGG